MTLSRLQRDIAARLATIYPVGEARAIARMVMEHVTGHDEVYLLLHADTEASDFLATTVERMMTRLITYEPVQYVTGMASFAGYTFKVNPATLIPRPETAQLVDIIADTAGNRSDLRVLDVGTGSGCIACTLALRLRFPQVTAIDISPEAVATARENASRLKAKVTVNVSDALTMTPAPESYDIIVSNPPYIDESEKAAMEPNVLRYEPDTALFVSDKAPLIFYRAINACAIVALSPGGRLYYEINPLHASDLRRETIDAGFTDVELIRDFQGLNRFLTATKPDR